MLVIEKILQAIRRNQVHIPYETGQCQLMLPVWAF
jgi:hypothetical protein